MARDETHGPLVFDTMLFVSLDSPVYLEILQLLHHQVINTPQQQAAEYCYFYLQVLKRASLF